MFSTFIYALSSKSRFTQEQFNELARQVYLPFAGNQDEQLDINAKQQIIRNLDALGYCEFDFQNRLVYMCKPSLILLPEFGLPKALLVGARTPQLEMKLKDLVHKRNRKAILDRFHYLEDDNSFPIGLSIQAMDKHTIREIAEKANIDCDITTPAAWRLVDMSASIDEVKNKLVFREQTGPNWDKRLFNTETLMFTRNIHKPVGDSLFEYRHPITNQLYHWLWNNNTAAEVNRDWGRYIALAGLSSKIIIFDQKQKKMAVPVTTPLPCLLTRATTLCSGMPPMIITSYKKIEGIPAKHPLQVYSCISQDFANLIAKKLNQNLVYTKLAFDKEGGLRA